MIIIQKYISLLMCLVLISLVGCNTKENNIIKSIDLTDEQNEILEVLDYDKEMNAYEYMVDDSYKSMTMWVEEYVDGKLVNDPELNKIASRIDFLPVYL